MPDDHLFQSEMPTDLAIAVAVLRERTEFMSREMRELKETQRQELDALRGQMQAMSEKMDRMIETMNQARGGWRSVVYLSGVAASAGGMLAWIVQHLAPRGTP